MAIFMSSIQLPSLFPLLLCSPPEQFHLCFICVKPTMTNLLATGAADISLRTQNMVSCQRVLDNPDSQTCVSPSSAGFLSLVNLKMCELELLEFPKQLPRLRNLDLLQIGFKTTQNNGLKQKRSLFPKTQHKQGRRSTVWRWPYVNFSEQFLLQKSPSVFPQKHKNRTRLRNK